MIYLVREADYDSCSHLALVEGPEMPRAEAQATFRRYRDEFKAASEVARKAFVETYGWFDKPLQGLTQENYHERQRDEFRKAGCWLFTDFLKARGFSAVKYIDAVLIDHEDDGAECIYAQTFSQDNSGIGTCLDLIDPGFEELAKVYAKKTKLEECCAPCQRRAKGQGTVQDVHLDWCDKNRGVLADYPNSHVLIDTAAGVILAHGKTDDEFLVELKKVPADVRQKAYMTHTSIYGLS